MTLSFAMTTDVARAFPEAQIGFVVAYGVRNRDPWDEVEVSLRELERRVASHQWMPFDETSPEIASWHEAYRAFGANPRRCRPSVDAIGRYLAP